MKTQLKLMLLMIAVSSIAFTGCKKDDLPPGAKKVSGIAYLDPKDVCNAASQGADWWIAMTGDLEGCWYGLVDDYSCTDGNYLESGKELFIGTYKGKSGSFWTTYDAQAKYEGCTPDGTPAGAQLSGGCQHYIVAGSGTGGFTGVTGRIDFVDNVEADPINYSYAGYLKF